MSNKTKLENETRKRVRAIHGREFVEMLDNLIALRHNGYDGDEVERLKRDMADYLNDIDRTGGIQVHG